MPPLNLRLYFDHEAELDIIRNPAGHTDREYVEAVSKVLTASLKRNYPEFHEAEFMEAAYPDLVDMVAALFTKSGFSERPLEPTQAKSPSPEASS
ncbi:MAG: hypothetical protein ACRESI_06650 [Gammaproteobacteria bacterium]